MSVETPGLSLPPNATTNPARPLTTWQKMARSQVVGSLQALEFGEITLREGGQTQTLGRPAADGLTAEIDVHRADVFTEMVTQGSLGAAESYLQGDWSSPELVNLLRILCRNMDRLLGLETGLARWGAWLARMMHRRAANTKSGSQKNIAAHYDLSNAFFSLFLDDTMMYSSGYFTDPEQSLREASIAKLDRICRKLNLGPEDHVLEIGTGWGGFAEYAARNYGCRITTTTISREQHDFAAQRFAAAGLTDQITLLQSDYRDLTGDFDKLVSIEMIEAVGQQFLPTFFNVCETRLRSGGQMLVQAILMPDHRYERYCQAVDFIQKYIFPGGHLPSVSAVQQAQKADTRLRLLDFEEFGHSYARTLACWREAFLDRLDAVRELGFDDRFIRMWDYYLCYCEAAFWERATSVGHFVWHKSPY